jgi:hypothetical protein
MVNKITLARAMQISAGGELLSLTHNSFQFNERGGCTRG